MSLLSVPANAYTLGLVLKPSSGSPTYVNMGCPLGVTQWPTVLKQFVELLCGNDLTRTMQYHATHYTLGKLAWQHKYGDGHLAFIQNLHTLDGTTNRFKLASARLTLDDIDPTGTAPTASFEGHIESVDLEPWPDNQGILRFGVVMQITAPVVWAGLPAAVT